MESLLKEIDKVRQKLKQGIADTLLLQKPFAQGMYRFSMFMVSYYSRVREKLKIDYDSFMIIQTVVGHSLHNLNKKKKGAASYDELETEWEKLLKKHERVTDLIGDFSYYKKNTSKLTISSICLVTSLPKETVRRKVNELTKKNLLKISKKEGVILGIMYKKVFQEFVPQTTLEVSKLLKNWEKSGVLKSILNFKL